MGDITSTTLIGVFSAIGGFVGKSLWDYYFGLKADRAKLLLNKKVDFLERQLSEFYYPIYLRLQKDNVVWKRILDTREEEGSLKQKVGGEIEKNTVLPNHAEIVQIIEKHIHLAQADEKLFDLLLQYINHISVYKAIRDAGEYKVFPLELHEPYPNDLFAEVQRRTLQLQEEYNKLIKIS
jgi:hypothetical protein